MSTPSSTATDSATDSATSPGGRPRFIDADGLPSRLVRVLAWISFVLNVTIIATGGAVRLTGSGLGCSDWPVCVPGSLTPTPELGIHGVIEFGNRTLSGPLLIFAIAVLVLTWTIRRQRRDLFVISAVVLGLVASQAVIGGFVVWLHLNANLVGVHYVISLIIVCVTAAYLVRMYERPGARERAVPTPFLILAHITTFAMAITVFVGVLTTGAGPHSGDDSVVRDGFDASLLAHVHAWPGYAALALTVALVIWALAQRLRPRAWSVALLVVLLVQIGVGVYQARSGLPPLAVGVHMVLASLTAAAMTVVVLRLKRPVAA
ncbi:cytochrome oxidase assembly protein [Leucobacter sp. UCD-THU]|uniref:COX15/CtaA family protein n=1 Tax=Leucobacter sp. UCD-THU TaxID=1292023 RepID=UPI00036BB23A|nr:COX15/CtaA family protein [Leucobacter sp. UCD-THU]EYT53727.1 cytochrome oxidase assembly protein [Leucobacter sp. UCD-THU]